MEPNGPLKPAIIQKIRTQMGDDPIRWRREMMAEWAEDQDVWLTQSLIASCIGTAQNCKEDLKEYGEESERRGIFFAGLDLAQTRDYTALAVIEAKDDKLFLRHLKIFQQPTIYATVLGYLKMLQDRWADLEKSAWTSPGKAQASSLTCRQQAYTTQKASPLACPEKAKWQAYSNSAWQASNSSIHYCIGSVHTEGISATNSMLSGIA
jgi:hypothetical protein